MNITITMSLECFAYLMMKENDVNKIVFSSTAATYGEPKSIPIMGV